MTVYIHVKKYIPEWQRHKNTDSFIKIIWDISELNTMKYYFKALSVGLLKEMFQSEARDSF